MPTVTTSPPTRAFGRFELRRLLGKSAGTMSWLAFDPTARREVMLSMPRVQPATAAALEHWQRQVRLAARLNHPNLAEVAEFGVQDHWPFVAVDRAQGITLDEWVAAHTPTAPEDAVRWITEALRGLAFAHEAGLAHGDLQLHSLLIDERGAVRVMALAVGDGTGVSRPSEPARGTVQTIDAEALRAQRAAAARDMLAAGLLLHRLLTGQAPLDQADTALVIERMPPLGRELVRLPWSTPLPIPEALRAIANRCSSGQDRLRYQNARTLMGALTGWLEAQSKDGGGPLAVLADRLHRVGHLPALPGLAARVARITGQTSQRTDQIADQVLDDMALTFELLRTLNSAQVQGTQVQGNGPVLTLRRIISLIGVNGVRLAANTLRSWPGPLNPTQATALQATLDRVRLAGLVAQALRPAGYDAQVVYLVAMLQNLGRLMLRYHFADEAEQIRMLTVPVAGNAEAGVAEQPGLGETQAAYAVLGVDVDALGTVVARQWGLGDDVMHMARRLALDSPVRKADSDAEVLRLTASAANEVVDAVASLPEARVAGALTQIGQRYGRALGIGSRDVSDALKTAREALQRAAQGAAQPPARPGPAPQAQANAQVPPQPRKAAPAPTAR